MGGGHCGYGHFLSLESVKACKQRTSGGAWAPCWVDRDWNYLLSGTTACNGRSLPCLGSRSLGSRRLRVLKLRNINELTSGGTDTSPQTDIFGIHRPQPVRQKLANSVATYKLWLILFSFFMLSVAWFSSFVSRYGQVFSSWFLQHESSFVDGWTRRVWF